MGETYFGSVEAITISFTLKGQPWKENGLEDCIFKDIGVSFLCSFDFFGRISNSGSLSHRAI
jgi:hypothetical protein